ncbi:hypothetical protein HaLaN_31987, partial [Haematococcus lacustris]
TPPPEVFSPLRGFHTDEHAMQCPLGAAGHPANSRTTVHQSQRQMSFIGRTRLYAAPSVPIPTGCQLGSTERPRLSVGVRVAKVMHSYDM